MRKVKLIIGTYNSLPPEDNNSKFEEYYQKAYKIFLTTIYNFSSVKTVLHYSGALLEWIEEYHPEFISVLQEMVNSKQVELLSGGYYDPALTLLPVSDRVGQMEKLTTYLRKNFGKKPRGCFLTESVWDSSLVSNLKTCGFDYTFLDDNQFLSSGVPESELAKPVLTEDQGKIITIIPISSKLTSMFLRTTPEEIIDYLREQNRDDNVFTIMFRGENLNSSLLEPQEIKTWLERFDVLLGENSSWIETISPSKYVKQIQGTLNRVYFPQYTINGMRNRPLPLESQKELNKLSRHLEALGDVSHWMNSGFFKQFLSRYEDSSLLYSKMIYINLLVNQIKGDRSRKKTAREELWRAQSHYVYWHGHHLGIYDKELRERNYRFLIQAEKSTREKGIFKPGINHIDIDFDGKKEILYQGDIYNAYATCKGGIIFQLDYLKKNRNLLSTIKRIEESYHNYSENSFDTYIRKMFHDHFIAKETTIDEYRDQKFIECGSFIENNYESDSLNRENKTLVFKTKGSVKANGSDFYINITKKYKFNKNSLVVTYSIENLEELPIETIFAPELNFSLNGETNNLESTISSDGEYHILKNDIVCNNVNNFIIEDVVDTSKINISFSKKSDILWAVPQYSNTLNRGSIKKLYQFTSFLPQWNIKISPKQAWTISINLSLS